MLLPALLLPLVSRSQIVLPVYWWSMPSTAQVSLSSNFAVTSRNSEDDQVQDQGWTGKSVRKTSAI
jgi:hypothetical protein